MALVAHEAHPDDKRTWNDIVWCYDAICKHAAIQSDCDHFAEAFGELVSMHEFETNRMLSDTMCWRLRALLANVTSKIQSEEIPTFADRVFAMAQQICPDVPSEPYSVLCKAFYKLRAHWNGFPSFMEWWGWDSFRSEDYQCEEGPDGRRMPISLVEGCHIAVARILVSQHDCEAIRLFLPRMEQLAHAHPEMLYVGYYIGKLMFALGQSGEEALKALCPFVRKKKSEFWAWQLLAEAFPDNADKRLACLLRAAACKTKEEFLPKVRLELTYQFLQRHDYPNASYQLHKYLAERTRQQKMPPRDIWHLTQEPWYAAYDSNHCPKLPLDYQSITDEILFADFPRHICVVAHVNREKQMATVVYGKAKSGFFKYDCFLKNLRAGDLLQMRWEEVSADGYIKPLSCKCVTGEATTDTLAGDSHLDSFYRQVSGTASSNRAGTVWFLSFEGGSAFIPPELHSKRSLRPDQTLTAHILMTFNKARGEWGWRCIDVQIAAELAPKTA